MSAPDEPQEEVFADIILTIDDARDERKQRQAVAQKLGVDAHRIVGLRLRKESIDSRQAVIRMQMRFEVGLDTPLPEVAPLVASYPAVKVGAPMVIIVGFGPAGMFAALRCLELGLKPIVLERGKDVSARRFDLAPIMREGIVNEESNYCFGEGGAGTFSDGKLYTRATKRGPVQKIYETFVAHGAPTEILTDSHPHIGSNLLPNVVKAIRGSVLAAGGEVYFQAKVQSLLRSADGQRIRGVVCTDGREWCGEAVILATGHSARDIYAMLAREGLLLQRKAFAVGVRIEHPQAFIDEHQYHLRRGVKRSELLPAARYALSTKIEERGVHSFCMCPGGFIVPAATENDEVVVNGMSLSRRDSPFANSGFVVTVEPEDTESFAQEYGVLSGIAYQKHLEVATSQAGGGHQKAPAQRVGDFLRGRVSDHLLETSYFPGIVSTPLHELLPQSVMWRMREGLRLFDSKMRGFAGNDAQLIGCETRTSSPVRIPREDATQQHPELEGLFPCGEGAGYAGGIVSAAMDGLKCADAVEGLIRRSIKGGAF
ncbi:MAG: NAD(P)/FAD-dependent oxidoreductase [Akkermansia sp.]